MITKNKLKLNFLSAIKKIDEEILLKMGVNNFGHLKTQNKTEFRSACRLNDEYTYYKHYLNSDLFSFHELKSDYLIFSLDYNEKNETLNYKVSISLITKSNYNKEKNISIVFNNDEFFKAIENLFYFYDIMSDNHFLVNSHESPYDKCFNLINAFLFQDLKSSTKFKDDYICNEIYFSAVISSKIEFKAEKARINKERRLAKKNKNKKIYLSEIKNNNAEIERLKKIIKTLEKKNSILNGNCVKSEDTSKLDSLEFQYTNTLSNIQNIIKKEDENVFFNIYRDIAGI